MLLMAIGSGVNTKEGGGITCYDAAKRANTDGVTLRCEAAQAL